MQKSLSLVPILSQMTPVHAIKSHPFRKHFNIILPSTVRYSKWPFSDFTTKNPVHISLLPMRATCLVHLTILHFIIRILSGKQPPVTSSFSDPNISPSTHFLIILGLCYSFNLSNPSGFFTYHQVQH